MRVLVTGATGFVGTYLVPYLVSHGHEVTATFRSGSPHWVDGVHRLRIESIDEITTASLEKIDGIVHLAGMAHRSSGNVSDYDEVNHRQTIRLARRAAEAGVDRFVFLSTSKVFGDRSAGQPFDLDSPYNPCDDYSASKMSAEIDLAELAGESALGISALRPPVVVGANAKGNIAMLERLIRLRIPIPVPKGGNKRSFVSVETLAARVESALESRHSGMNIEIVTDQRPNSTKSLVESLSKDGRRLTTLSVPLKLMRSVDRTLGGMLPFQIGPLYEDFDLLDRSHSLGNAETHADDHGAAGPP